MDTIDNNGRAVKDIFSPHSQAVCVRRAMANVHGLKLQGAYRGVLSIGSTFAEVRLEPNDAIHIRYSPSRPQDSLSALVANGGLPGNVRFARNGSGDELLADTQVDGELHVAETLRLIRWGMRSALGQSRKDATRKPASPLLDKQQVQEALEGLKWNQE